MFLTVFVMIIQYFKQNGLLRSHLASNRMFTLLPFNFIFQLITICVEVLSELLKKNHSIVIDLHFLPYYFFAWNL